jgi:hypothetical protein
VRVQAGLLPVERSQIAVAKSSGKDLEYAARAEAMSWKDLNALWQLIKAGETPDWENGKAFEYLVIRAFRLNKLEADYPYVVPPGGKPLEQIDGLVYLQSSAFLVECKDRESLTSKPSPSFAISCFAGRKRRWGAFSPRARSRSRH